MASYVLNGPALRTLLVSPAGPVAQDLRQRANRVRAKARRLCPVDGGTLKDSITMELRIQDGQLVARVGTNVKYALAVHEGTRPYTVVHRNKPALSFNWKGAPVPANSKRGTWVYKRVNIPARAGNPFLANALDAAK
jgi:phage gpG-like protein